MVLVLLRVTVGLVFILMGSWKIGSNAYHMGGRVGELFTFMEATGIWWDRVGWIQVLAGILLITQRFATVWLTAYAGGALSLLLLHEFRQVAVYLLEAAARRGRR